MFAKFNKLTLVLYGAVALVIGAALFILISGKTVGVQTGGGLSGTLEVWILGDPEDMWRKIAEDLRKSMGETFHALDVRFVRFDNEANYEYTLVNALAAGKGPDIFMLKDSQILKHNNKAFVLTSEMAGGQNLKQMFSDAFADATQGLIGPTSGLVLGLPITLDTLALFYNKDLFNSANISYPPKTWNEFLEDDDILTKISSTGAIEISGAALGDSNVEHYADIFSALIMQGGGDIIDYSAKTSALARGGSVGTGGEYKSVSPGEAALNFYTSFALPAKKNYSWNKTFGNSLDAFAAEKTAMIFGFAGDIPRLKNKNPHLNFGVAPFPQPGNAAIRINYGRYKFLAVSHLSKNSNAAWTFISKVASKDAAREYALLGGMPPARRDLITPPKGLSEYLLVFYDQILSAKSWLMPDENQVRAIFKDMIESVVSRKFDSTQAINRADGQIKDLLAQFFPR